MTGLTDQGGSSTSFVYDDRGLLETRTDPFSNAMTLTCYDDGRVKTITDRYDASGNLLAEADATNQIQRCYIYGAGLLALVEPTSTMYCYHFDATGYTVALTDSTRTIVNAYACTPFGTIANQQESVVQPFSSLWNSTASWSRITAGTVKPRLAGNGYSASELASAQAYINAGLKMRYSVNFYFGSCWTPGSWHGIRKKSPFTTTP